METMIYQVTVGTKDEILGRRWFNGPVALSNRRQARRLIREAVKVYKAKYSNLILLFPDIIQPTLLAGINNVVFALHFDFDDRHFFIEHSLSEEGPLDQAKAIEYELYRQYGWNTGGDPVELFIEHWNEYRSVLKDEIEDQISIKTLLSQP